ncbi:MAG: hypothetical protein ACYCQJ_10575, partial [Nitrososphaerales archaeon]
MNAHKQLIVALIVVATAALLVLSTIFAFAPMFRTSSASSCTFSTTQSGTGYTYTVTITGKDLSCPQQYADSSHLLHVVLSTASAQNPYTISITETPPNQAPNAPTEVQVLGWANNVVFCSASTTACSVNGPWSGQIDATVQSGKTCNTAPILINFGSGQGKTAVILEAGVGGVCSTSTTTTTTSTTPTSSTTTTSTTPTSSTTTTSTTPTSSTTTTSTT